MKTYRVTKEVQFDAGHRVPLHDSKCRNPHGHRYTVRATVEGALVEHGSSTGMVMDFSHIKALLTKHVHDRYDHGFVVWDQDYEMRDGLDSKGWKVIVEPWHPTAENMAAAIFDRLEPLIDGMSGDARLVSIAVYETPTSVAEYGA